MNGIGFITDDKGRRTAVVINLKTHGALWKDFYDGLVVESRSREMDIPFEGVRKAPAKRRPSKTGG